MAFFILFASALRLYQLYTPPYNGRQLYSDDAIYMDMARSIIQGNYLRALHPVWMPVYPIFSSVAFLFIHNWTLSGIYVSLISGILLIIPVYKILKLLNVNKVYYLGLFLIAVTNVFVISSITPLTESLFTLATWTGIYFSLKGIKDGGIRNFIFSGILVSVAALTRSEGIFTFLGLSLVAGILFLRFLIKRDSKDLIILVKNMVVFAISFFLLYSVYQFGVTVKYKANLSSSKAVAIFKLTSPFNTDSSAKTTWAQDIDGIDTFNTKSEFFKNGKEFITEHKPTILSDWKIRVTQSFKYLFSKIVPAYFLLFFVISFFSLLTKKHSFGPVIPLIVVINLILTMLFAAGFQERYLIWIVPGVIISFCLGLEMLLDFVPGRFSYIINILLIGLFMFLIFNKYDDQVFETFRIRNLWWDKSTIKDYSGCRDRLNGKTVMTRHEGYVFDNGSKIVYTPNNLGLEDLLKYGKFYNTDYLIASTGEVPGLVDFLYLKPKDYKDIKFECQFFFDQMQYVYKLHK